MFANELFYDIIQIFIEFSVYKIVQLKNAHSSHIHEIIVKMFHTNIDKLITYH